MTRAGGRSRLDPRRPYGAFVEEEPDGNGGSVTVATVLLTNRECPWSCVFCDLWKNALEESVPEGAVAGQLAWALERLPRAARLKLYNAGSFFDPRAIPPADHAAVARLAAPFARVIVESHPALVERAAPAFRDLLAGELEVAMGLETVHPDVLPRLGKGMTLESYARAAEALAANGIGHRAFVLLGLPYVARGESLAWALRSAAFAVEHGARVVSLIPTRTGNPPLDELDARGLLDRPTLALLERAHEQALESVRGRAVVLADLWDAARLPACAACAPARRERVAGMNRAQRVPPRLTCERCEA